MEESKKYKKLLLDGSSLIESVIAITIIATCLLIAMLVFTSIINFNNPLNRYKLKEKISEIVEETRSNKNYFDESFEFEKYIILKKVEDYKKGVLNIRLTAIKDKDTLRFNYLMTK